MHLINAGASQIPESGGSPGRRQDGRVAVPHQIPRERGEEAFVPAHSDRDTGIVFPKGRLTTNPC